MKKFLIKFIIFISIVFLFISGYYLFFRPQLTGDIGRLGKIPFGEYGVSDYNDIDYTRKRSVTAEKLSSDCIYTIGDSFSRQGVAGYQQYVGKVLGRNVYDIDLTAWSPELLFVQLLNNELIPRNTTVIVESVGRLFSDRLAQVDLTDSLIVNSKTSICGAKSKIWSIEEVASWIRLYFFKYDSPIYDFILFHDFFSHSQYANRLFVTFEDFNFLYSSDETKLKAVANLLKIKQKADEYGVKLIYMVAADKYDLYSQFIIDNPYPANHTLDYFSGFDRSWFINTKEILLPYLESGTLDLYHVNDTHWSPIASEIVGNHIAEIIRHCLDDKDYN